MNIGGENNQWQYSSLQLLPRGEDNSKAPAQSQKVYLQDERTFLSS
jgi:hypothetical protein